MRSRYPYRLPVSLRLFFLGLIGVIVLGTFGYLDDSFGTDGVARTWSLWAFSAWLLVSLFSPYQRAVVVDARGVLVPSLWLPPFSDVRIPYHEITDLEMRHEKNGSVLVLWTKTGKRRIHGGFVKTRKWLNWGAPDEFWELADAIAAHYDDSGVFDERSRYGQGLSARLPRVDHKGGLLLVLAVLAGLWFVIHEQVKDPPPSPAIALVQAGWQALKEEDDSDAALARFREAVAADPGHADAQFGLAFVLAARDDLDGAVLHYRKAVSLFDPPFVFAHANLGLALLMQGETTEGHAMLLKALEIEPGNPVVLGNLAAFHCERGEYDEARAYVGQVMAGNRAVPVQMMGQLDARCMPAS